MITELIMYSMCITCFVKYEFKRFNALKDAPLAKFGFQSEN